MSISYITGYMDVSEGLRASLPAPLACFNGHHESERKAGGCHQPDTPQRNNLKNSCRLWDNCTDCPPHYATSAQCPTWRGIRRRPGGITVRELKTWDAPQGKLKLASE